MKTMFKRILSMVVLVALICSYGLGTTKSRAKLKDPQVSTYEMGNYLAGKVSDEDSKSSKAKKKETVYIELNGDGSTQSTTVSDVLEAKGDGPIVDESILEDIENLNGDEEYTEKDGKLVWDNQGKDITYQGTTDQEPPISVSISYALNGQDISAEDLEGQSGELQIQYKFNNNARTKGHDFVPFLVLGGFLLDNETFSNVKIDNGKIVDYDQSKIVLGYSVPGLDEHLHKSFKGAEEYLNKIDLPDQFTISADVQDCTMNMGLIIATSNIGDFNIKDSIDLKDINSKVKKLQDGADALVNGAEQLSDGTGKLASASSKVKGGADQLASGTKKLSKGTKKYHKGNKKFHKGLKKGLSSAKSGTKKLKDGSKALAKGAKKVNDGANKLDKGAGDLNSGSKKLSDGVDQIKYGFEKKGGLNDGADALKKGAKSANDGVNQIIDMLQATPSSLDDQINTLLAQVKSATGGAISTESQLASLVEGINSAVKGGTSLEDALAAKGLNASTYYSLVQAHYSIQTLESVKTSLSDKIASHSKEISALKKGMKDLEDGTSALDTGIGTVYGALSQLSQGASDLSDGTGTLKKGTGDLSKGTKSLKKGADTLNKGVIKLYSGVKVMKIKLGKASPKLVTGSGKLDKAIAQVYKGTNKFSNAIVPFCNGIDTLNDGTKKLKDGARKLNKEGIKKITSLFGKKAEKAIDSIQDLLDAGKSYKTFSGISSDMDGQVKFIYKTPEIGEKE